MEVPRYWRLQKIRYGPGENGEGQLKLAICPVCGEKIFPPNRPICPHCSSSMQEKIAYRSDAVGVGALTFVATNDGLKLLLFKEVDSNPSDDETKKKERVIYPQNLVNNGDSFLIDKPIGSKRDVFSRPKGINTVTGKVDGEQSQQVLNFFKENDALESLSFDQLPPAFVNTLFSSMLREIQEEVPGLSAGDLEDKIHFFSKSSFRIEQTRPVGDEGEHKALYNFIVFVLAILIEEGDLGKIKREGWQLYSPLELSKLDSEDFRKATLAVLDFLPAALLFLAEKGKISQEEVLVLPNRQNLNN